MSDYKQWQGKVTCGICGSEQITEVEIPAWADDPIVPIACDFCGHLSCQFEIPTPPNDEDIWTDEDLLY